MELNQDQLISLETAYRQAVSTGEEIFIWDGHEMLVSYAQTIIAYNSPTDLNRGVIAINQTFNTAEECLTWYSSNLGASDEDLQAAISTLPEEERERLRRTMDAEAELRGMISH